MGGVYHVHTIPFISVYPLSTLSLYFSASSFSFFLPIMVQAVNNNAYENILNSKRYTKITAMIFGNNVANILHCTDLLYKPKHSKTQCFPICAGYYVTVTFREGVYFIWCAAALGVVVVTEKGRKNIKRVANTLNCNKTFINCIISKV